MHKKISLKSEVFYFWLLSISSNACYNNPIYDFEGGFSYGDD